MPTQGRWGSSGLNLHKYKFFLTENIEITPIYIYIHVCIRTHSAYYHNYMIDVILNAK